jgi:hypothetical protein
VDHVIEFPAGATNGPNTQCKCQRHHRLKHEGRWRHVLANDSTDPGHPPGTIKIVSPTGHIYYTAPAVLGPVRKAGPGTPGESLDAGPAGAAGPDGSAGAAGTQAPADEASPPQEPPF